MISGIGTFWTCVGDVCRDACIFGRLVFIFVKVLLLWRHYFPISIFDCFLMPFIIVVSDIVADRVQAASPFVTISGLIGIRNGCRLENIIPIVWCLFLVSWVLSIWLDRAETPSWEAGARAPEQKRYSKIYGQRHGRELIGRGFVSAASQPVLCWKRCLNYLIHKYPNFSFHNYLILPYQPLVSGGISDELVCLVMSCDVDIPGNMLSGRVCLVVSRLCWLAPGCCDPVAVLVASCHKHIRNIPIAFVSLPVGWPSATKEYCRFASTWEVGPV